MPFINYPVECSSCRGSGQVKPACAFDVNSKLMTIECLNCRGKGQMDNKVYVNPEAPERIEITQTLPKDIFFEVPTVEETISNLNRNKPIKKKRKLLESELHCGISD